MMLGYACDETPELMPAPIAYVHQLLQHAATLRKNGGITMDINSAVVVLFDYGQSERVDSDREVAQPAGLVEQICELNEVDPKYVERTIARILRDEIAVEKKLRDLQSPEGDEQNDT